MKVWSIQEEAERLKKRFEEVNRAAFARDHKIKGGQAMIYQHITARRPMSLDAALAYAAGFGCQLDEISPRLADELQKAAELSARPSYQMPLEVREPLPEYVVEPEFFPRVDRRKFSQLSQSQRDGIEDWVVEQIKRYTEPAHPKSPAGKKKAA